jgi:hypothetical protein
MSPSEIMNKTWETALNLAKLLVIVISVVGPDQKETVNKKKVKKISDM